jgi:hypothetical protein
MFLLLATHDQSCVIQGGNTVEEEILDGFMFYTLLARRKVMLLTNHFVMQPRNPILSAQSLQDKTQTAQN